MIDDNAGASPQADIGLGTRKCLVYSVTRVKRLSKKIFFLDVRNSPYKLEESPPLKKYTLFGRNLQH